METQTARGRGASPPGRSGAHTTIATGPDAISPASEEHRVQQATWRAASALPETVIPPKASPYCTNDRRLDRR